MNEEWQAGAISRRKNVPGAGREGNPQASCPEVGEGSSIFFPHIHSCTEYYARGSPLLRCNSSSHFHHPFIPWEPDNSNQLLIAI